MTLALPALLAGLALGALYFRILAGAVDGWLAGRGAGRQITLLLLRLGLAGGGFALLAQAGALPLLLALGGFLLARQLATRRAERG